MYYAFFFLIKLVFAALNHKIFYSGLYHHLALSKKILTFILRYNLSYKSKNSSVTGHPNAHTYKTSTTELILLLNKIVYVI